MCGISGLIYKKVTSKKIQQKDLVKINEPISHRGPDGEGFIYYERIALGHRRLAIIDLSHAANQPMRYGDKLSIVFNGEIYNYLELKVELLALGYEFTTASDTEVILAAYSAWGEACVHRFNGMWAFALYDQTTQTVFISRDRFGVKPFYYTQTSNGFIFGSEIKQLLPFLPERKSKLRSSFRISYFRV